MGMFSILAGPLGIAMEWLYSVLQNYGWTIIVFTILARVVMFPLSIKQQKSTAKMSAYQPMIQEIQKKWANDKNKQNQEVQKFYEENNLKMTAGCAPMIINMLVIFGMIAVIQAPLNYILQVPEAQISNGVAVVKHYDPESTIDGASNSYTQQSLLIGEVKENPAWFVKGVEATDEDGKTYNATMDAAEVEKIKEFNFQFAGLNLANAPKMKFDRYLIVPILSVLVQLVSQVIIMKTNPQQQMGNQMMIMTVLMTVMFGFYAFRVPVGFSLYYTVSGLMMLAQQLVLRKIYDPVKIRAEVEIEIEARRAAKKAKKKVVVQDTSGEVVTLDVSEAEMNKLRLARAREMDAKKYEEDEVSRKKMEEAEEKARKIDEEKYGLAAKIGKKKEENDNVSDIEKTIEDTSKINEENSAENTEINTDKNTQEIEHKKPDEEYKPGRRMKSRKKQEELSFAEKEQMEELSKEMEEK